MSKKDIAWLFSVIVLSVALIISILLGVLGFYSSMTFIASDSDLVVGDTISIGVKPNESTVASMTFDGSFLPDENIPQIIQVNGTDLSTDVYVRVKAKIFGTTQETAFNFITTDHFEQKDDGYYYFNDILHGGNKITFCNYIVTPKEITFYSGEKYILSIVVETLDTSFDKAIWKNYV